MHPARPIGRKTPNALSLLKALMLLIAIHTLIVSYGQSTKSDELDSLLQKSFELQFNDFDSAAKLAFRAVDVATSLNDSSRLAESYMRLATSLLSLGDQMSAFNYFVKAREIIDRLNIPVLRGRLLSLSNYFEDNMTEAFKNQYKALAIFKKEKNNERIANALFILANMHLARRQMDSARYYLDEILVYASKVSAGLYKSQVLNALRYEVVAHDFKKIKSVLATCDLSSYHERDKGYYFWLQAQVALNENNLPLAELHIRKAIKHFEKLKNLSLLFKQGYATLSKILVAQHRYKEAVDYKNKYQLGLISTGYNPSLTAFDKYEGEQQKKEAQLREHEIQILAQENQLQQLRIRDRNLMLTIVIIAFLLMVLGSLILYLNFKDKKDRELLERNIDIARKEEAISDQQLKILELEKRVAELKLNVLRAQMSPHFIFNALNSVQSCIVSNKIDVAIEYLSQFSKLLSMIFENSDKPIVTLAIEIEALRLYINIESLRFDHRIKFNIEVDDALLSENVRVPSMLLQPFVENSIKHAFDENKLDRKVNIRISRTENKIRYVVSDNGVGYRHSAKKQKQNHKSVGLDLVREKLRTIHNESDFVLTIADLSEMDQNQSGTKVSIEFPFAGVNTFRTASTF